MIERIEPKDTPEQRLEDLAAHIRIAVAMAKLERPDARGFMGVGYRDDTGGALVCDFDSEPFATDVEGLLKELKELREVKKVATALVEASCDDCCNDKTGCGNRCSRAGAKHELGEKLGVTR